MNQRRHYMRQKVRQAHWCAKHNGTRVEHVTLVGNARHEHDDARLVSFAMTMPTHEPIDLRSNMTPQEYWRSFGDGSLRLQY